MEYRPTIGLEIHAELKTRTKMFCSSKNDPDETRPNVNVCPVCLAHPGTLPVINKEAVRHVLRVGAAVGGTLADYTEFDRKNYFYPDIPKGYQISQYKYPLIEGGMLAGVKLTRIHLEEDTARSSHISDRGKERTLVDFNRAGVPLMELVTEPVIHSAEAAGEFARELQLLLRTLEAGDANLEKGEMRIEANVSVSAEDGTFGTKVEIKNLNSFRSVERAIAFEIARQTEILRGGGSIEQQTRGWDENKQSTFAQRIKEEGADYRYFPEPDLPALRISEISDFSKEAITASLPELPWDKRTRYLEQYDLKKDDAAYIVESPIRSVFFDAGIGFLKGDKKCIALAANYFTSDLAGFFTKLGRESYEVLTPGSFAALITLVAEGTLSSRGAKDVLLKMLSDPRDPETIAREAGLIQVSDTSSLSAIVDAVLAREGTVIEEYRSGKTTVLQYLIGQAMKESRGSGNPQIFRELLTEKLA